VTGSPWPTMEYRGVTLRADPAREACFAVVHQHWQVWMPTPQQPSDPTGREGLHSLYNSEVLSLEIAAQLLVEHQDAAWELRLGLARQCWDEVRHAAMLIARLRELGIDKGHFPIINHEWNVVLSFDSLAARLAVQNRTFEGGSLDGAHVTRRMFDRMGDLRTAAIIDQIMADEVEHARFGNEQVRRLAKEDPRNVLRIAQAIARLKDIARALATQPGEVVVDGHDLAAMKHDVAVQETDRRHAGFTAHELGQLQQRDQRAAADHGAPRP